MSCSMKFLSSDNEDIRKRIPREHFDIRKKKNKEDNGISSLKYSSIFFEVALVLFSF